VLSHHDAIDWFATEHLPDGVTRIWEHRIKPDFGANMWLVEGRDHKLLIDGGFGFVSLREHVPELAGKPVIAVASHSHCDHIGSLHEFADCRIHAAEADILRNPTIENTVAKGYMTNAMFGGEPPKSFDPDGISFQSVEPARLLSDGDSVDLGDRVFEVVHLPGHSPGSIGLFERATGILFSGDVVHNGSNGIGRFHLYHSNMDDWLRSVERLRKLPVTTVHAGHFDSFGGERYMAILDEYLARRRMPDFPLILYRSS
jgi:glyoxylase-like metal-dependent hydrolase (beta-lactamase superfamily II)